MPGDNILGDQSGGLTSVINESLFGIFDGVKDREERLKEKKNVVAVVAEGIKDEKGEYICNTRNLECAVFGHKQMDGAVSKLAFYVKKNICEEVKFIEFNVLQRSAAHCAL